MTQRVSIDETNDGGAFFPNASAVETTRSGSTLLDLVNGGGWAVGGTVNLVGDKSTNKTGLATEAMANYHSKFPDAPIRLNDAEAAYDKDYARILGCPESVEPWVDCSTFERFAKDFDDWAAPIPDGGHGLYILDSLDSLTDVAEMERELGTATFGMAKAKMLSEFFRKTVTITRRKKITLFIVSQIRSAIGVSFGRPTTRAGGKALDFYALQVVYLTHLKRLEVQRRGVKRVIGVEIKASNEKNKISMPFRCTQFPVIFNFGIDDVASMASWLIEIKRTKLAFTSEAEAKRVVAESRTMSQEEWTTWRKNLRKVVRPEWAAIEDEFRPIKRKYD